MTSALEIADIIKRSRRFYREHDLDAWRRALPKGATLAPGEEAGLAFAGKSGLDEGFAFPPFATQMQQFPALLDAVGRRPAPGLADNQQYRDEPFLSDDWSKTPNGNFVQRTTELAGREDGPYVVLFSLQPLTNAWGRTGKQIEEMFQSRGWQGFTVPEYLVLQRVLCERFGDHRFLAEPQDDKPTHWLWLVDSINEGRCAVAMGSPRGINIQGCPVGNRESKRAALPALVLRLASPAT